MNPKQQRFCDEYLIDCNGARAYMVAYPDVKDSDVAKASASRLLTDVNVKEYISKHNEELHNSKICSAEEIRELLSEIARGLETGKSESIVVENIGGGISKAKKVTKRPDERDRIKALELLGKCNSLFTDKVDLKADIDIQVDIEEDED